MLDKIRIIKQRYDEVSDLIIQPEIIMDQKRYAQLSKEYKDLGGVVKRGEEYKIFVITAFGGDTGFSTRAGVKRTIPKNSSLFFGSTTNSDFINRGIDGFKTYINNINVREFKENKIQSSLGGFIPVELDITLEGLSGMKIYNKISINQRFLPPSYPKALKFVIRGVNHSVQNNLWETIH